ncbi:MAG TPA: glycosyltransferase [Candidatus Saccharimonadales bacterium]
MTVSFVVIAYNEQRSIERTVRAILAQNGLEEFEIIVVNDGSRDQTLEIVQRLGVEDSHIRVIDQPNKGRGAARAAGVAAAKGGYIAFVDADIVLPADWLTRCLPYLKDQGYDACAGTALPDGDVSFVHRITEMEPKLAAQTTTVTGSNGLFKRSVFDKVSYDASKRNGEDVALG